MSYVATWEYICVYFCCFSNQNKNTTKCEFNAMFVSSFAFNSESKSTLTFHLSAFRSSIHDISFYWLWRHNLSSMKMKKLAFVLAWQLWWWPIHRGFVWLLNSIYFALHYSAISFVQWENARENVDGNMHAPSANPNPKVSTLSTNYVLTFMRSITVAFKIPGQRIRTIPTFVLPNIIEFMHDWAVETIAKLSCVMNMTVVYFFLLLSLSPLLLLITMCAWHKPHVCSRLTTWEISKSWAQPTYLYLKHTRQNQPPRGWFPFFYTWAVFFYVLLYFRFFSVCRCLFHCKSIDCESIIESIYSMYWFFSKATVCSLCLFDSRFNGSVCCELASKSLLLLSPQFILQSLPFLTLIVYRLRCAAFAHQSATQYSDTNTFQVHPCVWVIQFKILISSFRIHFQRDYCPFCSNSESFPLR